MPRRKRATQPYFDQLEDPDQLEDLDDASKVPRLPMELLHRIADFLDGEWRTLGTLALVCKAWLPLSRKLLLPALIVWQRDHSLEQNDEGHSKNQVVIDLLEHPLATIHPFFQELVLSSNGGIESQTDSGWMGISSHFDRLKAVKALCFVHFNGNDTESFMGHLLHYKNFGAQITTINLLDARISSFQLFVNLILAFPCLETLLIDFPSDEFDRHEIEVKNVPSASQLPLSFTSLYVYIAGTRMDKLWNWLYHGRFNKLRRLDVRWRVATEVSPALQQYMSLVKDSLEHITVNMTALQKSKSLYRYCTHLTSLNFLDIFTQDFCLPRNQPVTLVDRLIWAKEFLSVLSTHGIREIIFKVELNSRNFELRKDTTSPAFLALDEIMARTFLDLKQLILSLLHMNPSDETERIRSFFREMFPLCHEKNLLKFIS